MQYTQVNKLVQSASLAFAHNHWQILNSHHKPCSLFTSLLTLFISCYLHTHPSHFWSYQGPSWPNMRFKIPNDWTSNHIDTSQIGQNTKSMVKVEIAGGYFNACTYIIFCIFGPGAFHTESITSNKIMIKISLLCACKQTYWGSSWKFLIAEMAIKNRKFQLSLFIQKWFKPHPCKEKVTDQLRCGTKMLHNLLIFHSYPHTL